MNYYYYYYSPKIYIVPRDSTQPVHVAEVPAHFNFHYANGYEDETTGDLCIGE